MRIERYNEGEWRSTSLSNRIRWFGVQEDDGSISQMNIDMAQWCQEGGGVDDVMCVPVSPGYCAFAREDSCTRKKRKERKGSEEVKTSAEEGVHTIDSSDVRLQNRRNKDISPNHELIFHTKELWFIGELHKQRSNRRGSMHRGISKECIL
jgi:hypothetical protein